jgi:predicted RNase H-like HicB family nuclease
MSEMHYVVVVEGRPGTNYSAYAPDLPGCVATGASIEECEAEMRDAIAFHLEGMRLAGETIPEPSAVAAVVVDVALAI